LYIVNERWNKLQNYY